MSEPGASPINPQSVVVQDDPPVSFGRFGQLVALVLCVIVPGLFTFFIAPNSLVSLSREEGHVSARVVRFAYVVVPVYVERLSAITEIDYDTVPDPVRRTGDRSSNAQSLPSAFLILSGPAGTISVPSSAYRAYDEVAGMRDFVDSRAGDRMHLLTVSSWMFGVFTGGLLSVFTLLYLVGSIDNLRRWLQAKLMPSKVTAVA